MARHDTGAYGSTGTVVAGRATQLAADVAGCDGWIRCRTIRRIGVAARGRCGELPGPPGEPRRLERGGAAAGRELSAHGAFGGTPRSVAFNVQGFRIAVNRHTGEIRILKSVHAADAGRVINPCSAGARSKAVSRKRSAPRSTKSSVVDGTGRVINPTFRDYHVPAFADIPRQEVYFAETSDAVGPYGAKSMSESPYNPVAAALGNALRTPRNSLRYRPIQVRPGAAEARRSGQIERRSRPMTLLRAVPRCYSPNASGGSSHE